MVGEVRLPESTRMSPKGPPKGSVARSQGECEKRSRGSKVFTWPIGTSIPKDLRESRGTETECWERNDCPWSELGHLRVLSNITWGFYFLLPFRAAFIQKLLGEDFRAMMGKLTFVNILRVAGSVLTLSQGYVFYLKYTTYVCIYNFLKSQDLSPGGGVLLLWCHLGAPLQFPPGQFCPVVLWAALGKRQWELSSYDFLVPVVFWKG